MTLDLLEWEQNTSRVNDFGFVRMRTHYCKEVMIQINKLINIMSMK